MEAEQKLKLFRDKYITNKLLAKFVNKAYSICFSSYAAEFFKYHYCLWRNKPYFGSFLYASLGDPARRAYMDKLVEMLSAQGNYLRILEVGSWAGGSAILWAKALARHNAGKGIVFCVDPWKPYFPPGETGENPHIYKIMDAISKTGDIADLFHHNVNSSGFGGKVISVRGFADDCLPVLKNEQFDIVYIDGDHSYRAVLKDLNNAKGLCRENGILCGDDLELQYTGANKQAIELNLDKDFATDPDSGTGFHPGVTKAVWDVFGQEVSCYGGFWAMRKSGDKFTSITIPG